MARNIRGSLFLSLDGVVQAPGGPTEDPTGGFDEGGWVFKLWDEGVEPALGAMFAGEYDLLLGRRTYDIFAAYWPYAEGEEAEMGAAFGRAAKYVLTGGSGPLEWENSHRLATIDEIASLKASAGPDLVIQGSATLYPPLLAAGLIDRFTLFTYPVVLSRGKRLFGNGEGPSRTLRLVDHLVTPKGTIVTTYEPAGPLPPYPPEGPPPSTSAREAERQRRMAQGSW